MKFKSLFRRKLWAYSLLEMVVTLALTSIVMLAMVYIVSSLLGISAASYNRSKIREDLTDFVDEFEKDLRNASKVGKCDGSVVFSDPSSPISPAPEQNFECVFVTDRAYMWTTCESPTPPICSSGADCTQRAALGTPKFNSRGEPNVVRTGNTPLTMCKFAIQGTDPNFITIDNTNNPISRFDAGYYLERFGVQNVVTADGQAAASLSDPNSVRRTLTFTAVASHPNRKLKINNVLRQSLITTKNFDRVIKAD